MDGFAFNGNDKVSENITIKNNKLRESIQIYGLYGDIIVEKNSMKNKGCIISIESLDIPTYISKEERIYCNFKFINNNGIIKKIFFIITSLKIKYYINNIPHIYIK